MYIEKKEFIKHSKNLLFDHVYFEQTQYIKKDFKMTEGVKNIKMVI